MSVLTCVHLYVLSSPRLEKYLPIEGCDVVVKMFASQARGRWSEL
jgi:hypothetical protein